MLEAGFGISEIAFDRTLKDDVQKNWYS